MMKGRKEMNEMVWNDLWQRMQQPTIKIEEKVPYVSPTCLVRKRPRACAMT